MSKLPSPPASNVVPLRNTGTSYREHSSGLAMRIALEAQALANLYADDLAGFVIVCVNGRGEWSLSFETDPSSPIGHTMLAGLASAAIQRDILARDATREIIAKDDVAE